MVKRIATPPMAEEADFFTVNQPYPLNFEWESTQDVTALGRWVVACLGASAPFWAFYYKPSAPAKIILEIEKRDDHAHQYNILGEHRWKEMLKAPTDEELGRSTQVFPCVHTKHREVQKDGWLRVEIDDAWFRNWSPASTFHIPFPEPHYCIAPHDDKTNRALCRVLPVAILPPPASSRRVVPGSGEWHDVKAATDPRSAAALEGAWAAKRLLDGPTRTTWGKPIAKNVNNGQAASAWGNRTSAGRPGLPAVMPPPGHARSSDSPTSSCSSGHDRTVMYSAVPSESQEMQLEALSLADEDEIVLDDNAPVINLWATAPPTKSTLAEEPLCPMHNRVCKKGICGFYADLLKRIERDERQKGIIKPYTGPYNIKVAEREEIERKEMEKNEKIMRRGNNGHDADGFTAASGKKRRDGGGRGNAWNRGRGVRQGANNWNTNRFN